MEIKKCIFDQRPSAVVFEGAMVSVNFDIEESTQVVNPAGEGQEEESRTVYLAHVIRLAHPLTEERLQEAVLEAGFDGYKAEEVAADTLLQLVQGGELNGDALALAKKVVIARISQYDVSDNVNNFTLNGAPMWLGREMRRTLRDRFNDEKDEGEETTNLVYGDAVISLPIDTAIAMIKQLERYSRHCYDQTALHKAAVDALETVEAVLAYDFTEGYEANPEF